MLDPHVQEFSVSLTFEGCPRDDPTKYALGVYLPPDTMAVQIDLLGVYNLGAWSIRNNSYVP